MAQTKNNCSSKAKQNLKTQGVKTFLPLVEITSRTKGLFKKELKPLFPNYIFLSFDKSLFEWRKINNTRGIRKLLVVSNQPQAIPDEFIEELQLRCDKNEKIIAGELVTGGDKVEVINGPFAKMVGTIEHLDSINRVILMLDLMGQKTRATVETADIKPAN